MTTIAWDGQTLAADRKATVGGWSFKVKKLRRLKDGSIAGAAGEQGFINEVMEWLDAGAEPAKMPACQRSKDDWQPVLVIKPDGRLLRYEQSPYPVEIDAPFFAAGSGRDYALAAMYLGKDAREAVEVASALDEGSGCGVDTLQLETGG